jgi:hypothetical protein
MQVQVSTDNHIGGSAELTRHVEGEVQHALARFGKQIIRVEVHLSDVNGHKSSDKDLRCVMETRLSGVQPVAVNHHAATLEQAIGGAVGKMQRALEHTLGKLGNVRGCAPAGGDFAI